MATAPECSAARPQIHERAAIGEQKEALFALHAPDESGMFYKMYQAVQPRLVRLLAAGRAAPA